MGKGKWCYVWMFLVLFFGLGVKTAQASDLYPATVILHQLTDTYEAPNAEDLSGVRLTPQEVYITGMLPGGKNDGFNWYLISTWRGQKWAKLADTDFYGQEQDIISNVALLAETELYDEPLSGSRTGIRLGKQTVQAVAICGSFVKIETWLGSKWIRISGDTLPGLQVEPLELTLDAAATPVFAGPDREAERLMELAPQTVYAFERINHWYHIRTYNGSAWINPDIAVPAHTIEENSAVNVQQKTVLYAYPSFSAKPLGVIAPQEVKVTGTSGGWKRIYSEWVGEAWLFALPDPDAYIVPPVQEQQDAGGAWTFIQTQAAGTMGKEYPLNTVLVLESGRGGLLQTGEKLQLGAGFWNYATHTVHLEAPAQFAIDIVRLDGGEEATVWSVLLPDAAASIAGQGYYWIGGYTWDQKDANGNQVPQGNYAARLRAVQPVMFTEDGVEGKRTLAYRSYFMNVPFRIPLPADDRLSRFDTAKELLKNELIGQMRSSVPDASRIADYQISNSEIHLVRESYDEFAFTATYSVLPASGSYVPEAEAQSLDGGWIGYVNREFLAVRQGDGYQIVSVVNAHSK